MKREYVRQYEHAWRILAGLVHDFDPDSWLHTGRGANTPARIATHILQGTKYYIGDTAAIQFESGRPFNINWISSVEDELPTQDDIIVCIDDMKVKTEKWIEELDFPSANDAFPWTGKSKLSVVLFLLRHTMYHIGEMSALLNESKDGETEDNWVKAL